jgi:hypothetical protein
MFEQDLGDGARRFLGALGPKHRHIASQIAMLALFRRFQKQRGELCRIQLSPLDCLLDGSGQ